MKLSEAIKANDPAEVRKALKRCKDINRPLSGELYPPLSYAASKNADQAIPVLIEAGAVPKPDDHCHPVAQAAWEGNDAALAALLDARSWEDKPLKDAQRSAALHDRVSTLKLLFEKGKMAATPEALCAACMTGREEALRYLLDRGGDPAALDGKAAAIHVAARAGFPKLLREMLARGVDVNLRDSLQRTPLMYATLEHLHQRYERVRNRQRRRDLADPNSGIKLLTGTVANPPHAQQTIKTLLAAGADPTLVDKNGQTALDILIQDGQKVDAWLRKTLDRAGAPPTDVWLVSLMDAISKRSHAAVANLLSQGRSPNVTNARGFSPLTQACRSGDPELVKLLLNAGADSNRPDGSETPLFAAVVSTNIAIVQLLLDAGADPNLAKSVSASDNPLNLAKSFGYREIAELLVKRGARLPSPTKSRVEPGVHWWDDWEFIVVKADVPTIAAALDPTGQSIDLEALGKTFSSSGSNSFVLVQPKGLAWTNVLQVSPTRRSMTDDVQQLARQLAQQCNAPAIYAAYSDTAVAAMFVRYEPDGEASAEDISGDLDDAEMAVELSEEQGIEPPAWAVEMLRQAEESEEAPLGSSERLEALAKAEGFALGWAYFGVELGAEFEVEFPDYPAEAFHAVAFVNGQPSLG